VSADTLTPAEAPFTEALQRALAALDDITRTQTADTGTYTYRYADLGTILGAVRPRLAEHGLAVVQLVSSDLDRGAVLVSTQLRHCSGQTLDSPQLAMRLPQTPQQLGSLITYLRRYSVLALLGLATEDDDGAAASTGPVAPRYDEQRSETPEERLRASAGALFSALGLEPQQRLDRMAAILGRDVDSWGELSLIEQRRIVEQLQADRHG
jgi:hypothetical protein